MSQQHHGQDYKPADTGSKEEKYIHAIQALSGLADSSSHPLSNTSNLLALLKQEFNWWWIGYYWLHKKDSNQYLALGQFQGPLACTKLFKGKGVCGTSWSTKQTIIVPDVDAFPGHIACSSASKSQIVIPIFFKEQVIGVLDIDSEKYNQFDEIDKKYLNLMVEMIGKLGDFQWFAKHM